VGEHFGMHAKSFMVFELAQNSVGNTSYSHLEGCPVFYVSGYVITYTLFCFGGFLQFDSVYRLVRKNGSIYSIDMDNAIPVCLGYIGVHLCYDLPGDADCRERYVHGSPQRAIPVPVWRRNLDKGYING